MSVDKDNRSDDAFVKEIAAMLQESAENIDAASRSRLNRARQAALAELDGGARSYGARWWLPAGATALAAVLAVNMWLGRGSDVMPGPAAPVTADVADFELLLDEENLEMLEDLEFFAWLSEDEFALDLGATG